MTYKRLFYLLVLSFVFCLPASGAEVYLGLQAYGGTGKALGVGIASFTSPASDSESSSIAGQIRNAVDIVSVE